MDYLYKLNGTMAVITISKNIYPLITIKKAIANYIEIAYIKLEEDKKNTKLKIQLRNESADLESIVGEFYNELLRESLRYDIANETKNLRELILGRALYTTCIDVDDKMNEEKNEKTNSMELEDEFDLDEIAVNWFDTNNNREKKC